ncbi:MAG: ABC transporter permease [Bacteroidetes bacterium]|nr:MAG: ABC transporter permease [Bacteroidota bacterium]
MKQIWIITKKELQSFFDSLIAYIMLIAFLGFSGFFTWLYGSDVFLRGQADLQVFFAIAYWTLFFFVPALTMKMLAEENKTGTIELLLTKAVSDWQVVVGKFLSCLLLVIIALVLSLPYYFTVWKLGPIDHSAVWCGYLGLILMSATYISIGIFTSSITSNQIVAFLLALFIGMFFHIIFDVMSNSFTGMTGEIFSYLSLSTHYESITRGVIDTKDLIYFLTVIFIGLLLSEISISKRNIAG